MESIACDGHQHDRHVDVVDGIAPSPTSIKEQMPFLAKNLQLLAASVGRDHVQKMVAASVALRAAFDADDYPSVNRIYRSGQGWITAEENGFFLGVPEAAMRAFAKRHRRSA